MTCVIFVFSVLAEYTTVLKLRSMKEKPKVRKHDFLADISVRQPVSSKSHPSGIELEVRPLSRSSPDSISPSPNNFVVDYGDKTTQPLLNSTLSRPATPASPTPVGGSDEKKPTKYFLLACKFEKYTPRIMPVCFLIFIIIYWPYLLIRSDYYKLSHSEAMYYSV